MVSSVEKKDAIFALAKNIVSVKYEDIPTPVAEMTKMDILDSLGVAIAASGTAPACKSMVELAEELGGKEESTIIAYGSKVPSFMAAFVNSGLVHYLNYDDLHDAFFIHVACSVFPAAFAIAERVGKVTGREFITAYTLAIDLECKLSRALISNKKTPSDWTLHGWMLSQTFGYFGAAAVAGKLLGLNEDQLVDAFGFAYCQAAGNMEVLYGVGGDKGIYPSWAAKGGVLSALMAQKGLAGPKNSLEGSAGLFNVYFNGEYDSSSLTTDLGKSFEVISFYAFPCCGFTHSYIELALRMRDEHHIQPEDVEAMTVFVGPMVQKLCEPLQIRRNPRIVSEAKYSIPFAVATAIAKGKPCIKHFTNDGIKDPEILRLSNKVSWQADQEYDAQVSGMYPAKVEIKLRDGRVLRSEHKSFRYGHPQRPMSKEELTEKFRECASYSVRPLLKDSVEKVIGMVNKLEEIDDVSEIIHLVS